MLETDALSAHTSRISSSRESVAAPGKKTHDTSAKRSGTTRTEYASAQSIHKCNITYTGRPSPPLSACTMDWLLTCLHDINTHTVGPWLSSVTLLAFITPNNSIQPRHAHVSGVRCHMRQHMHESPLIPLNTNHPNESGMCAPILHCKRKTQARRDGRHMMPLRVCIRVCKSAETHVAGQMELRSRVCVRAGCMLLGVEEEGKLGNVQEVNSKIRYHTQGVV